MSETLSLGPAVSAGPDPSIAPGLNDVLGAVASLGLLGLCAGLGSGDLGVALRTAPSAALVAGGSALLTGPALVVVHQFVGLDAPPEALVGAMGRGFVRAGGLARGLAPVVLFFAATSGLGAVAYLGVLAGIGLAGLSSTLDGLVDAERAVGPRGSRELAMAALALGWAALTGLVALRLGWDVSNFIAG